MLTDICDLEDIGVVSNLSKVEVNKSLACEDHFSSPEFDMRSTTHATARHPPLANPTSSSSHFLHSPDLSQSRTLFTHPTVNYRNRPFLRTSVLVQHDSSDTDTGNECRSLSKSTPINYSVSEYLPPCGNDRPKTVTADYSDDQTAQEKRKLGSNPPPVHQENNAKTVNGAKQDLVSPSSLPRPTVSTHKALVETTPRTGKERRKPAGMMRGTRSDLPPRPPPQITIDLFSSDPEDDISSTKCKPTTRQRGVGGASQHGVERPPGETRNKLGTNACEEINVTKFVNPSDAAPSRHQTPTTKKRQVAQPSQSFKRVRNTARRGPRQQTLITHFFGHGS